MEQMMKQMGMDVEELDAERIEIDLGGRKIVFDGAEVSKIDMQGKEMFSIQGSYHEEDSEENVSQEDIEIVCSKTGASEEEAESALESSDDIASAVKSLS